MEKITEAATMIIDKTTNLKKYFSLNSKFKDVSDWLHQQNTENLQPGRYEISGQNAFALVLDVEQQGEKAVFEAHKRYIDIHCTIIGKDQAGWKALSKCTTASAYNEKDDYNLFSEKPELYVCIPEKHMAIFFPEDAHAPLSGAGRIKKIVFKVKVDE